MSQSQREFGEIAILRQACHEIAGLLASGDLDSVIGACASARIGADDLRDAIDQYGRRLIPPPTSAYANLDALRIKHADNPTWSVRAPMYTAEEGRSDLTLELTISFHGDRVKVELDDLHVL